MQKTLGVRIVGAVSVALIALSSNFAHAAGSCGEGGEEGDRVQVDHDGSVYYVTTPSDYSGDQPVPLIFGLHGDEGDPASSVNWFWNDVPDGSFIFVAPKAPNESGSWYAEQEANEEWFDALIETVKSRYNVDLDRIYIWGLSGGAMFSSKYTALRQDVFAAAEFNMGGSGTRQYQEPQIADCKLPARFVVSPTDFLVEGAQRYYTLLTDNNHETEWVDADCEDHCWDETQMEGVARDWLMTHTLCGRTPETHCEGEPPTDPGGTGGSGEGETPSVGSGEGGTTDDADGDGLGSGDGEPGDDSKGDSEEPDVPEGEMAGTVAEEAGGCQMAPSGKSVAGLWGLVVAVAFAFRRRQNGED